MNRPIRQETDTGAQREAAYPISPVFLQRWSPRAFLPEPMPQEDLYTILEAARWAPSAFNIQPWRFIHSLRGDAHWERFLALLDPFNAGWAANASALVFITSDQLTPAHGENPPKPSRTHSFDAGAAWAHLALQATQLGYQAHAMAGIRFDAVRRALSVPAQHQIEIAVAIGVRADPASLPPSLGEREQPSERLPLDAIAFPGRFTPDQGGAS
jgi:nitroreductase